MNTPHKGAPRATKQMRLFHQTNKLWGGRFKGKTNPAFDYFSSSLATDFKIASYDIEATKVHCGLLAKLGILTRAEFRRFASALDAIRKELGRHESEFLERKFEDIHSFIEAELERRVGPAAKKIRAGRSRNDQVNQAVRMYTKDHVKSIIRLLEELEAAVLKQARRHSDLVVAGYTHLQKAQPIVMGHLFLSYLEALERSKERLEDALKRVDVLTLGSGALAGTSLKLDRTKAQKEIGFSSLSTNSLDAVGARDFIAEILSDLAILGTDLSRIAEDLLLGQIDEIGWFEIPEELSTGSSMMPQKRNPDFLELARGAAAALIGNAVSLLALLKGLPSSYNRDLQWDKRPLFDSIETMTQLLYLFRVLFDGLRVRGDRTAASARADILCATDVAEYLVEKGVSFRDAHEKVGEWTRYAAEHGVSLKKAPPALLKKLFGRESQNVLKLLDPYRSVQAKRGVGSTHPEEVRRQIRAWEKKL